MNAKQLAAEEIRKNADKWRSLIAAADELQAAGDLEAQAKQLEAKVSALTAKADAEEARFSKAGGLVGASEVQASKILKDAKAVAERTLTAAGVEATKITAAAKAEADRITAALAATKAGFDSDIARLRAEAATVTTEVNAKGDALKGLKAELDGLKKKLG